MSDAASGDFPQLHKQFQNRQTNLCRLQEASEFSRYILIRSLDNAQLKEMHEQHSVTLPSSNSAKELYRSIFESSISIAQLKTFIRSKYPAIKAYRAEQEVHLPAIIEQFGVVKCGVRNDNLNDVAKSLVRDKTIASYQELQNKLSDITQSTIKGYIEWQYYNQATNDLIEHFFNDHGKVIPTLRKITYIDFILDFDSTLIPFDLKITHISDDYFDLLSRGLDATSNGKDSYEIGNDPSEVEFIKSFYKTHKAEFSLPNYGGLKKSELIDNLRVNLPSNIFLPFKDELFQKRLELIDHTENNLQKLEWWNYKFQGERLFKNNNRFFIFLVYNNDFEDARPLKGRLELIKDAIKQKLDNLAVSGLNTIKYSYEKDQSVNGDYQATSCSILIRADV